MDKARHLLGGRLRDVTEWVHALIIGPVADRFTGETVVDVTDKICAEVVKGFKGLGGRMKTPVDLDHGLDVGITAESKRTYGLVTDMEHREGEGVFVKLALNDGGVKWVQENEGNAFVSPSLYPRLFDPQKPDTLLSAIWMRALSLTPTPRQPGGTEIQLSEGVQLAQLNSRPEAIAFEEALRIGAHAHIPVEYLYIEHWEGAESGEVFVSWWDDSDTHLRRLTWARSDDGTVTVTGPPEPAQQTKHFEVIGDPMPRNNAAAIRAALNEGKSMEEISALLGEQLGGDVRQKIVEKFRAAESRAVDAETKLGEMQVKLSEAETKLTEVRKGSESNAALLTEMQAKLDKLTSESKARECAEFVQAALSEGRIPAGDVRNEAGAAIDGPAFWAERFNADADTARLFMQGRAKGAHSPPKGGAPVGVDVPDPDTAKRDLAVKLGERANQIQADARAKGEPIGYQAAWDQAKAEIKGGGK